MRVIATDQQPFGGIELASFSTPLLGDAITVKRVALERILPNGMRVDCSTAYLVSFNAPFAIHDFSFDFTLTVCETRGSRNSGESLDAQSWSLGDGIVTLGTEDGEALHTRMRWLEIDGQDYPIEYLHHGMRVSIRYVAPNTVVSFHFVAAYNRIDAGTDSDWFAVDVPHARIVALPVDKMIHGSVTG